jgi:glycosyltransferase involved in cell wall biosynthesis
MSNNITAKNPLRIAVMLRAYDRSGGIGIYSRNIVKHILDIDRHNHYFLLYNNKSHVGTYAHLKNVFEAYLPPTNPVVWDQLLVPRFILKNKIDLVFNTKFSVPLPTKAKKIMVLHGASWFVHPELYKRFDIFYVNMAIPLYCRKADFLLSNSNLTTKDYITLLKVPENKIETVLLAAGENFKPVTNSETLEKVKIKYSLPQRYILTVTSYDPRKNFQTLLKAFERFYKVSGIHLLVVGKDCQRYAQDHDLKSMGLEKSVIFTGWIDQADLPAIYSSAESFVFPSIYEEFGIPVVEAMASGCPVVSSNTGAIPELTSGAALLCDPMDACSLADNLLHLIASDALKNKYRRIGLERSKHFSWKISAQKSVKIFESLF